MLETSRKHYRKNRHTNDIITEKTKEKWQGKRIHGEFPRKLDEKLVDNEQSYR